MTELEQFEQLKKNILNVDWSMDDAPYFGFNKDNVNGVRWSIKKILKDTGITIESILKECEEKNWFEE